MRYVNLMPCSVLIIKMIGQNSDLHSIQRIVFMLWGQKVDIDIVKHIYTKQKKEKEQIF